MKRILILSALFVICSFSLAAQTADDKGPKYKNRKPKDIKSVALVSVEQSKEKGPKRKNTKTEALTDASKAKRVNRVTNKEKGPKAKNSQPGI